VCVLDLRELKVFFPVRALFLQRRGTVTDFHPAHRFVVSNSRILHIAQVLALGYGTLAKLFTLDRINKILRATGFNAGLNQITHGNW
jgi:hypothetical protein